MAEKHDLKTCDNCELKFDHHHLSHHNCLNELKK